MLVVAGRVELPHTTARKEINLNLNQTKNHNIYEKHTQVLL